MKYTIKEEYLRSKDKKLKNIIDKNGHIVFKPSKANQFDALVGIVISQFISTAAANSIFNNIKKSFDSEDLNVMHFQNLSVEEIKQLGLSKNKAKTIKQLSQLTSKNRFKDLSKLSPENLNKELLNIFGIGPWSVSMFEIFCIGKLDIFSSRDAGLRLAMNNFGFVEEGSDWTEYDKYAEKWAPFRTIASLHLWKTVD